jgi:hypothetical protein
MKKIAFIVFNVLLINTLLSQNLRSDFRNDSIFYSKEHKISNFNLNKTQFHFSMGASVTSFDNNTFFSKWIAPELTYKVNPKLNLHLGSMYLNENYTINSFNYENQEINSNTNFTRAFVYLSGDYKLNSNIRLRATTFNEVPQKNSQFDNFGYNQVGFDLKITDNFYMSADFISIKGRSPVSVFSNNPFFESNLPFGRGYFNTGW